MTKRGVADQSFAPLHLTIPLLIVNLDRIMRPIIHNFFKARQNLVQYRLFTIRHYGSTCAK